VAPISIRILTIKMVVLFRMDDQCNLALSSRTGAVKGSGFNVGDIRFDELLHNGAVSALLHIKCISISIQRPRLREKLSAVFAVVSPALANRYRITIVESVRIAIHGFVSRFIIVPCFGFKHWLRSTAWAHGAVDVL
jgi:hypothetical protein